jgi:uncharacterized protein (TIGR03435 family)
MRYPLALALLALASHAQTFEVATVKLDKRPLPVTGGGNPNLPPPPPPPPAVRPSPTGLSVLGANLKYCLQWAYNLKSWQISGPDWISTERYEIVAKTAEPVEVDQLKLLLRALLTERFRMTVRLEKKEAPVMAIVRGPGEPKLKPSAAGKTLRMIPSFPGNGALRSVYASAPVSILEGILSVPMWDPVLDMTGLTAVYDFTFERPGRDADNPDSWGSDIKTAVEKQLGLKLEPRRTPMDFLVVERAEKTPVEN